MSEDDAAQENEILALESIFEKDIVSIDDHLRGSSICRTGKFNICPDIAHPPMKIFCNYLKKTTESKTVMESSENHVISSYNASYLPPICLRFVLPEDYPSVSSPQFTLTCVWLDRVKLSSLASKLDYIWSEQEGREVLFLWAQFLKEDVLNFLDLTTKLTLHQEDYIEIHEKEGLDIRVMQDVPRFSDILPLIQSFDDSKQRQVFENTPFPCDICFTEKYGRNCVQFKGCGHVYCDMCLKSYFNVHIKDGNMKALICPEPGCESQVYPAQIKNLVSERDFERYEALLLQTTLDTMNDITYCPRKFCQSPVIIDEGEVIGMCTVCQYSFCTFCKLAYHGIEPCKLKQEKLKEVCQQYKDGDSTIKKELEGKYGAKVLQETINNIESERWLASNSKSCPGCGAAIEKQSGCNKMTCYKCKCYFCWLCMKPLSKANPYSHYNTSNSRCYNKLFDGVIIDDEFEAIWNWIGE